ncbi:MAG: cysteine hydrolase [Anaerolineae bacterium]|nr:cysteine hydrolase [Anaerolineae bacterium]
MIALDSSAALLLIDVQVGLDEPRLGQRSNPDAEANMARLLAEWRAKARPIFHVQHMSTEPNSPLRPELPGNAIKGIVAPQGDEPVIQKQVSNAFVGTELEARLRRAGVRAVIVVGLTTEHCVSSTARMASDLGFTTLVVADATACHDRTGFDGVYTPAEDIHRLALVGLQDEFAEIVTTEVLLSAKIHEA